MSKDSHILNGLIHVAQVRTRQTLGGLPTMKKTAALLTIAAMLLTLWATFALAADVHVRGYQRQDGTYVQEHMRSAPDSTRDNNFSTRGNTNPYTGEAGHKSPDYGSSSRGYGSSGLGTGGSYGGSGLNTGYGHGKRGW